MREDKNRKSENNAAQESRQGEFDDLVLPVDDYLLKPLPDTDPELIDPESFEALRLINESDDDFRALRLADEIEDDFLLTPLEELRSDPFEDSDFLLTPYKEALDRSDSEINLGSDFLEDDVSDSAIHGDSSGVICIEDPEMNGSGIDLLDDDPSEIGESATVLPLESDDLIDDGIVVLVEETPPTTPEVAEHFAVQTEALRKWCEHTLKEVKEIEKLTPYITERKLQERVSGITKKIREIMTNCLSDPRDIHEEIGFPHIVNRLSRTLDEYLVYSARNNPEAAFLQQQQTIHSLAERALISFSELLERMKCNDSHSLEQRARLLSRIFDVSLPKKSDT